MGVVKFWGAWSGVEAELVWGVCAHRPALFSVGIIVPPNSRPNELALLNLALWEVEPSNMGVFKRGETPIGWEGGK